MNEPRAGKKLLVLDLDHTILDFKNATEEPEGFVDFGMFLDLVLSNLLS